jgi:hypothetical protein
VLAAFRSLPSEAFLLSSSPSKANAKSLRLDQSQTETDCVNNLVKLSHEYCAAQDGHSSNGRGCSVVDGTTCQYSDCGRGTGLASCAVDYASGVTVGEVNMERNMWRRPTTKILTIRRQDLCAVVSTWAALT